MYIVILSFVAGAVVCFFAICCAFMAWVKTDDKDTKEKRDKYFNNHF